jgi:hypothetical protein
LYVFVFSIQFISYTFQSSSFHTDKRRIFKILPGFE